MFGMKGAIGHLLTDRRKVLKGRTLILTKCGRWEPWVDITDYAHSKAYSGQDYLTCEECKKQRALMEQYEKAS
jgi:hypothetical protein